MMGNVVGRNRTVIDCYDYVSARMQKCDQRQMMHVPWQRIAGFLEVVEAERAIEAFAARALGALDLLFDFDQAFFIVTDARDVKNVRYFGHRNFSESMIREYLTYYAAQDTVIPLIPSFRMGSVDWK